VIRKIINYSRARLEVSTVRVDSIIYGQRHVSPENRLKKHFVITSNVLLFGYSHVSDSAKTPIFR